MTTCQCGLINGDKCPSLAEDAVSRAGSECVGESGLWEQACTFCAIMLQM